MTPTLGPDPGSVRLIDSLARSHPTPFYVYHLGVLSARVATLRAALPAGSRLFYSAKANPHARVLAAAAGTGCGVEVASPGELRRAVAAGVDPGAIAVVGPAKSDRFLSQALRAGAGALVVESVGELRRLDRVADDLGGTTSVAVLLRLCVDGAKGSLRMAGHQFGMDRDDALSCHALLAGSPVLRFAGYHGYLASQLLSAEDILHNVALMLDAVRALTDEVGLAPDHLDLGGGFGIPYTPTEPSLDLCRLAAGLDEAVGGRRGVWFESGRYLAGPAGVLVCRVVDTKTVAGRRFVLLDGGMNASGMFGAANAARGLVHSVIRDGEIQQGGDRANICGPLCTPMDRLATAAPCAARVGDLVAWWNMGAYGFTAAPTAFLSFPPPGEVVIT